MSLEFSKLFNFLKEDTFFHKRDPRAKFLMVLSLTILSFIFNSLFQMLMLLIYTFFLLMGSHLWSRVLEGLKGLNFLIFFILVLNTTVESLNFALIVIIRLIVLMIAFSLFFQTTLPEDLTQSLISIKIPYSSSFALSLAFRFVPTMAQETEVIIEAQRSRGHKLEGNGLLQQIKNLFPLLIPLIVNSIRRAYHVAEALETRGFGVNKKPSFLYPIKFDVLDTLLVVVHFLILSFSIFFSIYPFYLPPIWMWNLPL